jgi:DNA polymerase-3 subunit epsilon
MGIRRLLSPRPEPARAYARAKLPRPGTPWREAAFTVVDLELTGLDADSDEIISFAAVPVLTGRVVVGGMRRLNVRPKRMPAAETIRVHGLRPADLTEAPSLDEALPSILEALAGRVLVAHPARVERAFLAQALARTGTKLREPVICTATLAGRLLNGGSREVPLAEAADALGLPAHDPHTAAGDALTTAQLFIALATHLDGRGAQTVGSLARLSSSRTTANPRTRIVSRG